MIELEEVEEPGPMVLQEGGHRAGSGGENKPHSQFCYPSCLGHPWMEGQRDLNNLVPSIVRTVLSLL